MPIPEDPDEQPSKPYQDAASSSFGFDMRRRSEESIRTEYCDGPIQSTLVEDPGLGEEEGSNGDGLGEALCSDRAELIERIKRGESPTWVPNEAVSEKNTRSRGPVIKESKRPPSDKTKEENLEFPTVETALTTNV